MERPGKLIAEGRDSNIYEFGHGKVLRRSRNGRSQANEAKIMQHVRARGFPTPEVFSVSDDGLDMVMARVEGRTMIDALSVQPWKMRHFARELSRLHVSLHRLDAPEWLPAAPGGSGDSLLHMDLHPLNVMLSNEGPVVLDWANASRGNPLVDVAATWVLLACAEVTGSHLETLLARVGRTYFLHAYLGAFSKIELETVLSDVVEWKRRDPHMSASEIQRMHALLERHSAN
ncbi:MAG TPA: phosphotransferase [Acidimicrobiales bacterium]|nr:phosphotransferase [Acidimicrobiales bacterium]